MSHMDVFIVQKACAASENKKGYNNICDKSETETQIPIQFPICSVILTTVKARNPSRRKA